MNEDPSHPKELAEEALQVLIPFAHEIARLCESAVVERSIEGFQGKLLRIIRSIQLLCGAVDGVEEMLRVEDQEPIVALEKELQFILMRILDSRNDRDDDLTRRVLRDELAPHLHSWSRVGIPGLLRSRDC